MIQPLKTVIIGFGEVASGYASDPKMAQVFNGASHVQTIERHPAFVIHAVVDPSKYARRSAREDWNIDHCVADIGDLADPSEVEVAVLTCPSGTRMAALEQLPNLKAVLAEKPLGQNDGEARAFVDYCAGRALPLQVNYWRRGAEGLRSLAAGQLQELVGKPQAIFGLYGNGLFNNGCHLVDFIRFLFGEVKSVQATSSVSEIQLERGNTDKHVGFALTLPDGLTAQISALDFSSYREVGLDIWGRKGRLSILQEGLSVQYFPLQDNRGVSDAAEVASDQPQMINCPVADAHYNIYENLWQHLNEKRLLTSPGSNALATEEVLLAIEKSIDENGTQIPL
jgi:predicted dehydrogenase